MDALAHAHGSEPFHTTPAEAMLVAFGTGLAGLDDAEAARRLAQFGANRLTQAVGRFRSRGACSRNSRTLCSTCSSLPGRRRSSSATGSMQA